MRMRKGSTASFWNKLNRQQNELVGVCMPSLKGTATTNQACSNQQAGSRDPIQDSIFSPMIDQQSERTSHLVILKFNEFLEAGL